MLVLGLETSGQPGSVALISEQGTLARRTYEQPNAHAEQLLEHVELTLLDAGCERRQLDRVAVGTGPGNFTGLRVGMALASGIGLGLGIPVMGVCSLASMAAAIEAPDTFARFVVRDARRGEVFCAAYTCDGETLVAPTLVTCGRLFDWLTPHFAVHQRNEKRAAVIGDGLQWLTVEQRAALAADIPNAAESVSPDAQQTARIGLKMRSTDTVVPVYVREADAVLPQLTRNVALYPPVGDE